MIRRMLLLALLLPALALADERILSYDSQVDVRSDGSLEVVEHIKVRAEGDKIRRGIYREFPTRYRDRHGNRVVVGFEVLEVRRDGQPEPWFTEDVANGVRINTGNDHLLAVPLDTTYSLRYRTTRQIGFFDDHDELYWNAIGHGWRFPIDTGSVEVRLPQPVPVAQMAAEGYSGAFGTQGQDFTTSLPAPGIARWQLARPLQPGEGLTVVLSLPKDLVAAPGRQQRLLWLLDDNRGVLIALLGLVVLLVFCVLRWRRVGRDPAAGTIIVRYEPPPGHSPAGLRYMARMGYDTRCFSADLLASAVDGAVAISREKGFLKDAWQLQKTGSDTSVATPEQRALLARLFDGGDTLELDNANAATMQAAISRHRKALSSRFQPALFSRNGGSIAIAAGITVTTAAVALALGGGSGIALILAVLAAMLVVLVVFGNVIKAPTPEGRRLMDEIEGLKRYLQVAESDELARLAGPGAPPALDAQRYEHLLPYAVALEVEDAWTKKFTLAVGTAAAAAATSAIAWYHGAGSGDIGSFARTIGSSFDSRISSSSTPPGSSSGGGGGGSSGGGGGGGGGGGR